MGFLSIFKNILPQQGNYFTELENLATGLQSAGVELQGLITAQNASEITRIATRIKEIEHASDEVTHGIFEQLNRTFITPIDREDIYTLANALDDTLDLIDACVARIALYRMETLTDDMKALVRIIGEATGQVQKSVADLQRLSKHPDYAGYSRIVHRLEKEGDAVFRRAMAALFLNGIAPIELVKQKDILEGLENSIDYCQTLSNIVDAIAIKNS